MCYSRNLSLTSFIFGIMSSVLLLKYGNEESKNTNLAIASFFIFVSIMQFIEYLLWSDINCVNGLNKFGSIIGPLFNQLQPVMLLIFASMYVKSLNLIPNNLLITVNLTYLIYMAYKYINFIDDSNNLCTGINSEGHLSWKWMNDFNYKYYHLLLLINLINYYNNINFIGSNIITYILFIISYYKFNKNVGEIWCLMVTGAPLFNLFLQKILNINN